jgi:hypothetical protein
MEICFEKLYKNANISNNINKTHANIYDVSELVKIPEINNGFCRKSDLINFADDHKLICLYIKKNNLNIGDVIYIGDAKFVIVIDDINHNFIYGENPALLIFQHITYLEKIKNKNVSYTNLFNKLKQSTNLYQLFFENNYNNIIKQYEENNLI